MQAVDDARDVAEELVVDDRRRDPEQPGGSEDDRDLETDEDELLCGAVCASLSCLLRCSPHDDNDSDADDDVGIIQNFTGNLSTLLMRNTGM